MAAGPGWEDRRRRPDLGVGGSPYRRRRALPPAVAALIAGRRRPRPKLPGTRSTDIERALKLCLMALRIDHLYQVRIGPYTVDFLLPDRMIVLEADGFWHSVRRIQAHDKKRDLYLKDLGYRVIRLGYDDLISNAVGCVTEALRG